MLVTGRIQEVRETGATGGGQLLVTLETQFLSSGMRNRILGLSVGAQVTLDTSSNEDNFAYIHRKKAVRDAEELLRTSLNALFAEFSERLAAVVRDAAQESLRNGVSDTKVQNMCPRCNMNPEGVAWRNYFCDDCWTRLLVWSLQKQKAAEISGETSESPST